MSLGSNLSKAGGSGAGGGRGGGGAEEEEEGGEGDEGDVGDDERGGVGGRRLPFRPGQKNKRQVSVRKRLRVSEQSRQR